VAITGSIQIYWQNTRRQVAASAAGMVFDRPAWPFEKIIHLCSLSSLDCAHGFSLFIKPVRKLRKLWDKAQVLCLKLVHIIYRGYTREFCLGGLAQNHYALFD